jgi:biopolymer transport protein ExbB/TolQ
MIDIIGGSGMIRMFVMGGPYAILLGLLAIVIITLSIKKAIDLFARSDLGRERLSHGLNAILFWGCLSGALGLLGQANGLYISLSIVARAEGINPQLFMEGLAVSLIPTLFGLGILVISSIIWFVLRFRLNGMPA